MAAYDQYCCAMLNAGVCVGGPCAGYRHLANHDSRILVQDGPPAGWEVNPLEPVMDSQAHIYVLRELTVDNKVFTYYSYTDLEAHQVAEELLRGYYPRG